MDDRRSRLKRAYKALYAAVESILFENDPIRINFGFNTDEYDPEVGTILPRLKDAGSEDDVATIIHQEFVRWFGQKLVAEREPLVYRRMAADVWKAWLKFRKASA